MDGIYTNGLRSSLTNGIREREAAKTEPEFLAGDIIEGIVTRGFSQPNKVKGGES